jgi:hypothetical protein
MSSPRCSHSIARLYAKISSIFKSKSIIVASSAKLFILNILHCPFCGQRFILDVHIEGFPNGLQGYVQIFLTLHDFQAFLTLGVMAFIFQFLILCVDHSGFTYICRLLFLYTWHDQFPNYAPVEQFCRIKLDQIVLSLKSSNGGLIPIIRIAKVHS